MKVGSKHTPGAWHASFYRTGGYYLITGHGKDILRDESEANARLISAAPELLIALKTMLCEYECRVVFHNEFDHLVSLAKNAIIKAEGGINDHHK